MQPRMTATKANYGTASAVGSTLVGVPLAQALAEILVTMTATPATLEGAFTVVFSAVIVGVSTWFGTFYSPANRERVE